MKMKITINKGMAPEMEDEKKEGDVGEATPAHEAAETGTKEHEEDMAEDASEGEMDGEEEMGMEGDWKAECDANDLMRAAEIKNDPARMKKAMEILQKKKAAIESVADLKAARNAAFMKKGM